MLGVLWCLFRYHRIKNDSLPRHVWPIVFPVLLTDACLTVVVVYGVRGKHRHVRECPAARHPARSGDRSKPRNSQVYKSKDAGTTHIMRQNLSGACARIPEDHYSGCSSYPDLDKSGWPGRAATAAAKTRQTSSSSPSLTRSSRKSRAMPTWPDLFVTADPGPLTPLEKFSPFSGDVFL